jgi:hypothetical protein
MCNSELLAKKLFIIFGSTALLGTYLLALWIMVFSPRLGTKSELVNPTSKVGYPTQQMLKK